MGRSGRGVVVVPFDDPLEERAQHGESVADGGGATRACRLVPRRTACQDSKSSMWVRSMVATDTQAGSAVVTRWANNLRAKSAADTVFGRAEASSWSR